LTTNFGTHLVANLTANLTTDLLPHGGSDGIANDGHNCANGTTDSTAYRLAACRSNGFASGTTHL
jgi:hypothetical protein